ncbi:MAG: dTDP-4-dehydrorhamnose reductase [Candidatus Pelagibacter sp.]|nr:dTDP-4-dehydrorhamnose reductase [Candidatus Pelagibacter sp.]
MKILLTGSEGQLATSLSRSIPQNIQLIQLNKRDFNLLEEEKCKQIIQEIKPRWVINCAAYTNVDLAQKEYDIAYKINTIAPLFLTKYIEEIHGKLLHISTDYVFDGESSKPYQTLDETNPLNNYGTTKAEGEKNILQYKNNIILRTSWLYSSYGQNFITTMLKLHSAKGKVNENIKVVYDQISAPTSTNNLSKLCWRIIREDLEISTENQILHWHDGGVTSWYDFAIAIGEIANKKKVLDHYSTVLPIKSSEYKVPATRPLYSLLDIEKTEKQFNIISNHWRYELEKTIEELK